MIKRSLNVGVVGLGHMGNPIARNLAFRSRTALYLQLHSRDKSHAARISDDIARDGAQCAMRLHHTYPTVTKWCDVVITCLKSADVQRNVMLERDDALVKNARPGQIFVDHTTIDPELARACADVAEKRGAFYLDCPLSGNPQLAAAGELTAMSGGNEQAFLKVLPLIRLYCENVERIGNSGSGAAAKLICQTLVAMHSVAAAEAMTMADVMGIENSKKLFSVLDASWAASTMLRRNAPLMERMIRNPELVPKHTPGAKDANPASFNNSMAQNLGSASVDRVLEDISLIGRSTQLKQEALPVFAKAHNILWRTSHAGIGDRDLSAVVHFLESDGPADPLMSSSSSSSKSGERESESSEQSHSSAEGKESRTKSTSSSSLKPRVNVDEFPEVY